MRDKIAVLLMVQHYGRGDEGPAPEFRSLPAYEQKVWHDRADVVLEAMMEPTPGMIDAGVAMALQVSVHGEGGWSRYIGGLHTQMIQAARDGK